jgi:hypothetical protein
VLDAGDWLSNKLDVFPMPNKCGKSGRQCPKCLVEQVYDHVLQLLAKCLILSQMPSIYVPFVIIMQYSLHQTYCISGLGLGSGLIRLKKTDGCIWEVQHISRQT